MTAEILRASASDLELPLLMPGGDHLILPGLDLALTVDDDKLQSVVIEVTIAHEVYELIEKSAMFHLEPEHRGPNFEQSFDATRDVELELSLASSLVERLAAEGAAQPVMALGAFMDISQASSAQEPILDGANWYALNVKQDQGGGIKTGYATTWAKSTRLG